MKSVTINLGKSRQTELINKLATFCKYQSGNSLEDLQDIFAELISKELQIPKSYITGPVDPIAFRKSMIHSLVLEGYIPRDKGKELLSKIDNLVKSN